MSMRRLTSRGRAGFSLVEVLIAVLILAIGLLGLGAVIPVVVRQQRDAADATMGVTVANAARDVVLGPLMGGDRVSAWDTWFDDLGWSPDFRWEELRDGRRNDAAFVIHPGLREQRQALYWFDETPAPSLPPGTLGWYQQVQRVRWQGATWANEGSPSTFRYQLTVRDRLWPSPAIVGTGADRNRPQYIWDIVGRRVDPGVPQTNPANPLMEPNRRLLVEPEIQLAIFVRRIDMNIRIPGGNNPATGRAWTLYDVLTMPDPNQPAFRLPVAVDARGMPTLNGIGEYAAPRMLDVQDYTREALYLSGGTEEERTLASQIGQRLVDNLGQIYTVRHLNADGSVRIEPQIPGHLINTGRIEQVAFTPQIPAAVQVINIRRPVVQP